jgi:MFS transporter, FHS family, glucose/mannose:H+ symporter
VENAFGGWIASYAKSLGRISPALAVMSPAFFYGALLLGRLLAPLALRRFDEIKVARAEALVACAGMLGLIFSGSLAGVIASACISGCGLAAVYPITISLVSRQFAPQASRVGSVVFTMSNFGGASLPWLVGFASTKTGNLRIGLAVPLIATAAIYALYWTKWKALPAHEGI